MINKFWAAKRREWSTNLVARAAHDLIRKELVPNHAIQYIKDNIKTDGQNRMKDRIKTISCPICGIILPSRFLMRQHIKIHGEAKENEPKVYNLPVEMKY